LITGDFMHHPIQFHDPGLSISADVDNNAAIATRRRVFAEYRETAMALVGYARVSSV
jgi:hypothetical protein